MGGGKDRGERVLFLSSSNITAHQLDVRGVANKQAMAAENASLAE